MFVKPPSKFLLGIKMEVPSKLRRIDRDGKRHFLQLGEEVISKDSGTGNARKKSGGSEICAAIGQNNVTLSSKSTNLEHESYSPTFLPPMHNATGRGLRASSVTGDLQNQTVCVPHKTYATEFRSDFRAKYSDLQSKRLVEGNIDKEGEQVAPAPYDGGVCETNIRSKVHKAGHDAKCSTSPSEKPPDSNSETNSTADTRYHNPRVRENQHLQTNPAIRKNTLNGPAQDIIWKGDIEIRDCPPNLGFCEGVLAHPSAKVARKAYSFSKRISRNLQFVMYSQGQLSPDIFKMQCPDRDDIALYFYPGNYERSKHQYSSLLRFMQRKDLMLRSRMGSVELLVYPSSLLQVDSQKLDNCYFMWGVFRRLKGDTSSSNAGAKYSASSLKTEMNKTSGILGLG